MTIEDAIVRIKEHNDFHSKKEINAIYITEALAMAVKALEKQIAKRPKIKKMFKNIDGFELRCPNCEAVLQSDTPHCKYCGQSLDWSDAE